MVGLWSGLSGVAAATCRTTETTKVLAVPLNVWRGWWQQSPELADWLESHPQREDLYAALRPLLAERPRQDRTFLDEIDQLQAALRTAQLDEPEALQSFNAGDGISWFISSVAQVLLLTRSLWSGRDGRETLERALQQSPLVCGLSVTPRQPFRTVRESQHLLSPRF